MKYSVVTRPEKLVADYCGIPIFEVQDMCLYDYRVFLRDAVIHNLSHTESGREYLEKCWILEQTKPDRQALREKFGRKEG